MGACRAFSVAESMIVFLSGLILHPGHNAERTAAAYVLIFIGKAIT